MLRLVAGNRTDSIEQQVGRGGADLALVPVLNGDRRHVKFGKLGIARADQRNVVGNAQTADSILFIGPALTPTSMSSLTLLSYVVFTIGSTGGNPAFKLYDVDPDTYEVMDVKVFMSRRP